MYLFRQFLHELYNSENLAFWLEVEEYKKLSEEERKDRSQEIYDKYFDPESKYELNVEGKMKKDLASQLPSTDINIFLGLQESVWNVLEHDCFPKFLQSKMYQNYKGLELLRL